MSAANAEWRYADGSAVHLDIVACVTTKKWSDVEKEAQSMMVANCRDHLEGTVCLLPTKAMLLFDGKTACETMVGDIAHEWKHLCSFSDRNGQSKTVRTRHGIVSVRGITRRFAGWNMPAKYLSDDALTRVGEWVRGTIGP